MGYIAYTKLSWITSLNLVILWSFLILNFKFNKKKKGKSRLFNFLEEKGILFYMVLVWDTVEDTLDRAVLSMLCPAFHEATWIFMAIKIFPAESPINVLSCLDTENL